MSDLIQELQRMGVRMRLTSEEGLMVAPHPELTEEYIERIRAEKPNLIHLMLEAMQEQDGITRCRGCYLPIRPTEAHLALELEDASPRPYHTDPSCRDSMVGLALSQEQGTVLQIHQVHSSACPDEEPGYGCSGGCF